jgi:hypothetical protein
MVALGACAAPAVFRLAPAPYSGNAMGTAFARFDHLALGAAVVLLAAEVTRTWAAGARARTLWPRLRRLLAIAMAGCGAYVGLVSTPQINGLHQSGAQRGQGPAGVQLDVIHKRAEAVGKAETLFGVALVLLHVLTLPARRPEDADEDDEAVAPLPPGPR